jgi:hypothetical protein
MLSFSLLIVTALRAAVIGCQSAFVNIDVAYFMLGRKAISRRAVYLTVCKYLAAVTCACGAVDAARTVPFTAFACFRHRIPQQLTLKFGAQMPRHPLRFSVLPLAIHHQS